MEEKRVKRNSVLYHFVVFIAVCIGLLVCYALSVGPARWLGMHGYLSRETFQTVYEPLINFTNQCPPLSRFLSFWLNLWYPQS